MKKIMLLVLIVFVAIQFYRPNKNNDSMESHKDFLVLENVPKNIAKIFKTSCYDCHSNHTDYVWFDNIAPLSWYVDRNIKRAKFSLNFSKWGDFEPWQRRLFIQGAIMYDINTNRMPPQNYLLTHATSKISAEQQEALAKWMVTVDLMKE